MNLCDLGHRFLVEPLSTQFSAEETEQLKLLRPAALMLRSRNFVGTKASGQSGDYKEMCEQLAILLDSFRSATKHQNILVTIDHEGGRVVRPPLPITQAPYPAYWGSDLPAVVEMFAQELRSLGVNLIFGPVADVNSNPQNPVIGERAFGRSVEEVIPAVRAYHAIMIKQGMLTCAKHFPGHGDTATDTHFNLPTVNLSRDQLFEREFAPFKALIEDGISTIMSAHILLPQLDSINPATMSPMIMNTVLRKELGFNGVTISDAIGMQAILPRVESSEFAENMFRAEVDMLCVAGVGVDIGTACRIADNMRKVLEEKSAELGDSFDRSKQRVDSLLERAQQFKVTELNAEIFEKHHALAERLKKNSPWAYSAKAYIPEGF